MNLKLQITIFDVTDFMFNISIAYVNSMVGVIKAKQNYDCLLKVSYVMIVFSRIYSFIIVKLSEYEGGIEESKLVITF